MQSAYAWDFVMEEDQFTALLRGELTLPGLGPNWAAVRLLECGTYVEIVRLLGFRRFVEGWPVWRASITSASRRRGFDFLFAWLPQHAPELIQ